MNSSRATIVAKHIFRPRRGVMVSFNGNVISGDASVPTPAPQQAEAPASTQVDWEAYVIDTTTHEPVEQYPRITSLDTLDPDEKQAKLEVVRIYCDRLRFADTKVDAQELRDKIAAGIWELYIEFKEPSTMN